MQTERQALLALFLTESEEHLALMEQTLVVLESRPEDRDAVESVFRAAHTLKGNSSSVGFDRLAELAHVLEDLLERVRDGAIPVTRPLVGTLLEAVDVLRVTLRDAVDGKAGGDARVRAMRESLKRELGRRRSSSGRSRRRTAATLPAHERRALSTSATAGTLRVDVRKLDRLLNLVGEIAVARGQLQRLLEDRRALVGEEVLEAHLLAERLLRELHEHVMSARMVPVGPTLRQYARAVRDTAAAHGKQARLVTEGDDVEVDASVIEQVKDPLVHLVRNSLDHGIESPRAREAAGKDPCGTVRLRAFHDAGSVVIEVRDDGAGLDRARILGRARERGVAEPERLPERELYRLVLEPGFSTAAAVTDLSGRGVGMDVVRRKVEALGGSVDISSEAGRGTTIGLRVPLTLAIVDGLVASAAGETYVLPVSAVAECFDHPGGDSGARETELLDLRGRPLPCMRLRRLFALPGDPPARESVIVVEGGVAAAGIVVDAIVGESQAVIRPLGPRLLGLPGLAGTTILGSGRVAFVLDVASLTRSAAERSAPAAWSPSSQWSPS
jgi:two-component system chemotaxis sensor kinase CheA